MYKTAREYGLTVRVSVTVTNLACRTRVAVAAFTNPSGLVALAHVAASHLGMCHVASSRLIEPSRALKHKQHGTH